MLPPGCGGRGRLFTTSFAGGSVLAGGKGGASLRDGGGSIRVGGGGGPARLLPPGAGGRGLLEIGVDLGVGGALVDDL